MDTTSFGRPRVVVTGMGQVSAVGIGLCGFREKVLEGTPAIAALDEMQVPGLDRPIGGRIPDWDPRRFMPSRSLRTTWHVTHLACAAAVEAFQASGLARIDRLRGGICLGTGFGGQGASEETYLRCFSSPGTRPRPTAIPTGMANATAGFLAGELGMNGPNLTIVGACASGTLAIGQAYRMLQSGQADVVLAGGADAPLTPITLAAWQALRALAPVGDDPRTAHRPFDQERRGVVLGEGAAFLVLERLSNARARGARLYGEVVGFGATADGGHITQPDARGIRACMLAALADAGLHPSEVGYVNAHGTGTLLNDVTEARALRDVFGASTAELLVSSTKPVHGHTMGASGALEAIATLQSLDQRVFPPTANLSTPDPDLPDMQLIKGAPRPAHHVHTAMSNSFGFGGNNAAIILRGGEP